MKRAKSNIAEIMRIVARHRSLDALVVNVRKGVEIRTQGGIVLIAKTESRKSGTNGLLNLLEAKQRQAEYLANMGPPSRMQWLQQQLCQ
jgi:hypothetical protein